MAFDPVTAGSAIAAIGAVGVAAVGLVDAFKTLPNGGLSNAGYHFIERALQAFFCGADDPNWKARCHSGQTRRRVGARRRVGPTKS